MVHSLALMLVNCIFRWKNPLKTFACCCCLYWNVRRLLEMAFMSTNVMISFESNEQFVCMCWFARARLYVCVVCWQLTPFVDIHRFWTFMLSSTLKCGDDLIFFPIIWPCCRTFVSKYDEINRLLWICGWVNVHGGAVLRIVKFSKIKSTKLKRSKIE